ncbi:hypothetical protein M758_UG142700 [Ceratodon purpureus]|nr:hypothetical protein M758_UG142700 [Ceratodon purpureus]
MRESERAFDLREGTDDGIGGQWISIYRGRATMRDWSHLPRCLCTFRLFGIISVEVGKWLFCKGCGVLECRNIAQGISASAMDYARETESSSVQMSCKDGVGGGDSSCRVSRYCFQSLAASVDLKIRQNFGCLQRLVVRVES